MTREKEDSELSEHDYVKALMDDFDLEESDTLGDLLKRLEDQDSDEDEANL